MCNGIMSKGFPYDSTGKKSTCSAGDVGSIPGIGHNVSGLYQVKGIVI